jgi:hypothetical protein
MRRVAEELGAAPSALYWHVRNKEELLQLVFDRVVAEIELPPPDAERWQEQLKALAREMRRVLTSHRDIARVSIGAIPVGPTALSLSSATSSVSTSGPTPLRRVSGSPRQQERSCPPHRSSRCCVITGHRSRRRVFPILSPFSTSSSQAGRTSGSSSGSTFSFVDSPLRPAEARSH